MIERCDIKNYLEIVFALGTCNKIYIKKLLEGVKEFTVSKYFEDIIFSFGGHTKMNNIYVSNKCKYYYK